MICEEPGDGRKDKSGDTDICINLSSDCIFYDGKCIWADLHFVSDTIEILLFYMQDQDGKEKRKERDNIP